MSDSSELFTTMQQQISKLNGDRERDVSDKIQALYSDGLNAAYLGAGFGQHSHQIANNFCKLSRYGTRFVMDNYVRTGYTFITRPELNLSPLNLNQNRVMSLLNSFDPRTIQFALRAYLDTRYARGVGLEKVIQCPFLDYRNPFLTLLTNNMTDISGGPSYQIEVSSEEGGFYGESQSIAIGSDSYKKPFDLQLGFMDPIGGPITALFKFWTLYIELLNTGEMMMYPDQIDNQLLNYTVSIYRFMLDPSFQYIQHWVKYTGCFPIGRPGASIFDYNTRDIFVDSCRKFSIAFRCGSGKVDEDDPMVIKEFNDLAERYFPTFKQFRSQNKNSDGALDITPVSENELDAKCEQIGLLRNWFLPEYNYTGVPYIITTARGPRLDIYRQQNESVPDVYFKQDENGTVYPTLTKVESASTEIKQINDNYNTQVNQVRNSYYQSINSELSENHQITIDGDIQYVSPR